MSTLPQPLLTYAELITPTTLAQALTSYQNQLASSSAIQGVTDWAPNSPQMAFVQLASFLYSQISTLVATNAYNSVEPNAALDFLTVKSDSDFDNQRYLGTQAQVVCSCSLAAGFGPDTFLPGDVQVSLAGAFNFYNTAGFTLSGNSTSIQTFIAADASSLPNSVVGGLTGSLLNAIQGLTVSTDTNTTLFNGCVSVLGTDTEPDNALHLRNETKFSTFTTGETTTQRIKYQVYTQSSGALSDVFILPVSPRGPGCIDAFCADPTTPASNAQLAAISGSVQSLFMQGNQVNFGSDTSGKPRVNLSAPTPLYFGSGGSNTRIDVWYTTLAPLDVLKANISGTLNTWVGGVPTGGNTYGVGVANIADVDDMVALLYQVPNVQKVKVANQSDISLLPSVNSPLKLTVIDWSAGGNWNGSVPGSVNLIQSTQ